MCFVIFVLRYLSAQASSLVNSVVRIKISANVYKVPSCTKHSQFLINIKVFPLCRFRFIWNFIVVTPVIRGFYSIVLNVV